MQLSNLLLATLTVAVPAATFTNGSLVPSYICTPRADGLPKSYGQLLPFTRKRVHQLAFNPNPAHNLNNTPAYQTNNSEVANSAYIMASLHNTYNSLAPIQQGLGVKLANGTSIVAGKGNPLILSSGTEGVALVGALLYAQNAEGKREGSFSDQSGTDTFVDFPGCGMNQQRKLAGVIQQQEIAEEGTFNGLVFNAPACIRSNALTLAGLSVTDDGFGVWKYNFTVTGSVCSEHESNRTEAKIPHW